jgi:hypothetical protein
MKGKTKVEGAWKQKPEKIIETKEDTVVED